MTTDAEMRRKVEEAVVMKEQENNKELQTDTLKNGERDLHKELMDARAAHKRIMENDACQ